MKKIVILFTALLALTSCKSLIEEWQPVFTGTYPDVPAQEAVNIKANTTIAQLCALYNGKPVEIRKNIIISGVVVTDDQPGNFYKSLYIQDETAGIELKIGKNGLYNDYRPGQTLYVRCNGLTLGQYGYKSGNYGGNGMLSLGYSDPSGTYETSYIENSLIIDEHILKGPIGEIPEPVVMTESQLPSKNSSQVDNIYLGRLVTLKGLKYANEVFCLLYLDSNKDKKSYTNRVFLSPTNIANNPTCGITTWAMSKNKMKEYLLTGIWDECKVGSGNNYTGETLADLKGENGQYDGVEKAAYTVSQYFTMGSTTIQVRTSGFCKFADEEIPTALLDGTATLDITGILTLYEGSIQFTVNSANDFVINQ